MKPLLISMMFAAVACGSQSSQPPVNGVQAAPQDAHLNTPVGGLENTGAEARIVDVAVSRTIGQALEVKIGRNSPETNATQLTILNSGAIKKGDVMLASFLLRGSRPTGKPARIEFLFEKATSPWTKSVSQAVASLPKADQWRTVNIAFQSSADYAPGEAMASFRMAFGPQTIQLAGFYLVNYGTQVGLEQLQARAIETNGLGRVELSIRKNQPRQTMLGFGGNFCQPRYGSSDAMDPVGLRNLEELKVVHARIGLPLNHWAPERGVTKDEGPARASLLALQMMKKKGIPVVVSVWEGPGWLQGGTPEQVGRTLPPDRYADCIEIIGSYLALAKSKYGVEVPYVSFNEPDYGVNFKFTPAEMAAFIKQAIPAFRRKGVSTKFLTADTANGSSLAAYAGPLLSDPSLKDLIGPIAFHSWDALGATDESYLAIAALGKKHSRPIWCLEAGHDAQLWQAEDPWRTWTNALRTAMAYERTLRLSGAELMSYWTYQDNYSLTSSDGKTLFPVLKVMRQMEGVFGKGMRVVPIQHASEDLQALGSVNRQGRASALLVNPIGPGTAVVSGFRAGASVVVLTSTDKSQEVKTVIRANGRGAAVVPLPSRSVVTLAENAK